MSAFHPIATEQRTNRQVGFVPIADSCTAMTLPTTSKMPRASSIEVGVTPLGKLSQRPSIRVAS